jgi:hypothetical protein
VLRVVKAGDLQPGDQFELGNILVQVTSLSVEGPRKRLWVFADVVLSNSAISSQIELLIYKGLDITVVGRAYESVLEKEFLDPPIDWGGHWSLIHGISGCESRKQSLYETEPRRFTHFQ